MIKCPKCNKEIFEESRFCPYCMTKFGDIQDYNKIKKRKTKIPGIIISILVFYSIYKLSVYTTTFQLLLSKTRINKSKFEIVNKKELK